MAHDVRWVGEHQARICRANGSPTYAALLHAIGASDNVADELLRADPGADDPEGTALHLRFLGAVHRLALEDETCPLRAYFPSTGGEVDVVGVVPTFFEVVAASRHRLAHDMRADVQTNEVGRAAPLSAAVNWVVARLGGPVRLLEVGASAGLNLWLDRYRVVAAGAAWGPSDSPVQLLDHFAAGTPPTPTVEVVQRRGCDRRPLDLAEPATRPLLRSFVWPEHVDRLARLDAALAAAGPVVVDEADACAWVAEQLQELPESVTTVVFHSVVMPYLPAEQRSRFAEVVRAAARPGRRLAWVAMEPTADYAAMRLTAEVWPPGEHVLLATATAHGRDISWAPTTPSALPGV